MFFKNIIFCAVERVGDIVLLKNVFYFCLGFSSRPPISILQVLMLADFLSYQMVLMKRFQPITKTHVLFP